ncbi:origin of replication complex subunit 3 isoform X1 [Ziziphus jujuba]|uniref:Origin of replication complex subunit 3 isoform X1 n=1 Tax=Ziziphus jujuba TaxID=326968 RepID=A0A6P3ZG36_ZIZJJ|nr:origin of replication complex subunit 3 isoform X1 [Ziziphus jujuba]
MEMAVNSVSPSEFDSSTPPESSEKNLQPFFILHKASSRSSHRRRIHLSPSKSVIKTDDLLLRMEAFQSVWSEIHSASKDVLRDINTSAFNDIYHWVRQSFHAITSYGMPGFGQATRSFPLLTHATSKQLFTGLVLTKNMEFVDDLLTFEELGLCLKSHGCHVANLSSTDFSAKNGIGGCLRSLLRQFLMVSLDAADMSILASWYREQGNYNSPLIVIVDDMERCCPSILSVFILTLSEWVVKIPIILIMGVATTLDAPRNILPSNVLQQLCPCKFVLGSPAERMDAVLEAALLRQCSMFCIGHKVAVFLRNYFLNQDGTVTSFIRALKIACAQHFYMEPLSFMAGALFEEDNQGFQGERNVLLEGMLKYASELSSPDSDTRAEQIDTTLTCRLRELKRLQKCWSSIVLCLYEAGKHKIRLLDIFCEALDPEAYNSVASDNHTGLGKGFGISTPSDPSMRQQCFTMRKGGFICQAIQKVRLLPEASLSQLLKSWENLTVDIYEIHDKVKELQSMVKLEEGRISKEDLTDICILCSNDRRHASWRRLNIESSKRINEKAASLIDCMVRDFLRPIECLPFHEIGCFRNVEKLQLALIGDPRRRVQLDLLEFHKILWCSCCSRSCNIPLPSMPDTSIMYTLAQEHGDLINLPEWFQSFKTIISHISTKGKRKTKQSMLPKKTKYINESEDKSEASIQARFCRAVTELQITGLIRMPTKRRPDCVQRVAFGL